MHDLKIRSIFFADRIVVGDLYLDRSLRFDLLSFADDLDIKEARKESFSIRFITEELFKCLLVILIICIRSFKDLCDLKLCIGRNTCRFVKGNGDLVGSPVRSDIIRLQRCHDNSIYGKAAAGKLSCYFISIVITFGGYGAVSFKNFCLCVFRNMDNRNILAFNSFFVLNLDDHINGRLRFNYFAVICEGNIEETGFLDLSVLIGSYSLFCFFIIRIISDEFLCQLVDEKKRAFRKACVLIIADRDDIAVSGACEGTGLICHLRFSFLFCKSLLFCGSLFLDRGFLYYGSFFLDRSCFLFYRSLFLGGSYFLFCRSLFLGGSCFLFYRSLFLGGSCFLFCRSLFLDRSCFLFCRSLFLDRSCFLFCGSLFLGGSRFLFCRSLYLDRSCFLFYRSLFLGGSCFLFCRSFFLDECLVLHSFSSLFRLLFGI